MICDFMGGAAWSANKVKCYEEEVEVRMKDEALIRSFEFVLNQIIAALFTRRGRSLPYRGETWNIFGDLRCNLSRVPVR